MVMSMGKRMLGMGMLGKLYMLLLSSTVVGASEERLRRRSFVLRRRMLHARCYMATYRACLCLARRFC